MFFIFFKHAFAGRITQQEGRKDGNTKQEREDGIKKLKHGKPLKPYHFDECLIRAGLACSNTQMIDSFKRWLLDVFVRSVLRKVALKM